MSSEPGTAESALGVPEGGEPAEPVAGYADKTIRHTPGGTLLGGYPTRGTPSREATEHFERIPRPRFEEYSEKFSDWYTMKRRDGIIEVSIGGRLGKTPNNLDQVFKAVGNDPDNRIMILTSEGRYWFNAPEEAPALRAAWSEGKPGGGDEYDNRVQIMQRLGILRNLIFEVHIPTIAAIDLAGVPGIHSEAAFACDITLCTEDTKHWDPHADFGYAPGDGTGLVYQELLGTKRAAYYLYTSEIMDAATMLQYGLVNEILPQDRLLPRAWEIADKINQMPLTSMMMTKAIVTRPWTQRLVQDLGFHITHESFGIMNDQAGTQMRINSIDRTLATLEDPPTSPS